MPKLEEAIPWAASAASETESYARKNIYFAGEHLDEVYDYCVWRTHVAGYTMLGGSPAPGVSSMLKDLVIREYLRAILTPEEEHNFSEWRRRAYRDAGLNENDAKLHPELLMMARYNKALPPHRRSRARRAGRQKDS